MELKVFFFSKNLAITPYPEPVVVNSFKNCFSKTNFYIILSVPWSIMWSVQRFPV